MEGFFKARKSKAWIEQARAEELARRAMQNDEEKKGSGVGSLLWALAGAGLITLLFQRPPVPPT